jgi:dTDP-4-amino-4,6-dideoxygalactose transaminase
VGGEMGGVAVPVTAPRADQALDPAPHRRTDFLLFSPPTIGQEEIDEVVDTLRSGWLTTGPKTQRFEREFARAVGAPAALALNSCTAGLHTALAALGIGPGVEVITSALTFVSTVNVIEHVGAQPRLVDIEPDTLNLSPDAVEAALTPRTAAIIAVHFGGHPAELDRLRELAAARGLALIEDAAHALPATYRGVPIGAGDNPVAFSFYATKNLTTGEGGMLTGAPDLIERARVLSLHGMSRDAWHRYERSGSWFYEVVAAGFKYNMSDLQAGIGLAQLRRLAAFQERRRAVVASYQAAFKDEAALERPIERPHVEHAWHLYVLRLELEQLRIDRDRFIAELALRNIGTSVHFIPIHLHPYYRDRYGWTPNAFPEAHRQFRRIISLPLHPGLMASDVDDVIAAVSDVARRYAR